MGYFSRFFKNKTVKSDGCLFRSYWSSNVYIAENSDFTDFPVQTNPRTSTEACQHPHSVLQTVESLRESLGCVYK